MQKNINFRDWWSAYGLWVALLFGLECYYLGLLGPTLAGFLIPVSITLSAMTALRLIAGWWTPTRFWAPYLVKWLSWWAANSLASLLVVGVFAGFICAIASPEFQAPLFIVLILLPPTWRLVVHVVGDIRWVRRSRVTVRNLGASQSGAPLPVPV